MPTFSATLIDRLGGNKPVAAACGVIHSAVSNWRRTGIPAAYAKRIAALASKLGQDDITELEVLYCVGTPKSDKSLKQTKTRPKSSANLNTSPAASSSGSA